MEKKFAVGIDLGTTNSVIAFSELGGDAPQVELLSIPQVVAPGQIETRKSLPSFLYLPTDAECDALRLPWDQSNPVAVAGYFARKMSAESPQRVVAAAKSWLAHHGVDRRASLLPWEAPQEVGKISPVLATELLLKHLVAAWNEAHPEHSLASQDVVLTVPASFDPAARDLTREAAQAAGLPAETVLLEEPQAAVYRWLYTAGDDWRKEFNRGDSLLVVDVGGGTTDLTLVEMEDEAGNVALRRRAVGKHLLVGGDNMDLALAHFAAQQLASEGHSLDPWQNVSLWHACRAAKETLLDDGGPERATVSVLGRGSRLIGGTISTELEAAQVRQFLTDGFFPPCELNTVPQHNVASGFQDIGLPYEADPAITHHLAEFLSSHCPGDRENRDEASSSLKLPSHVIFNGGVFRAAVLQDAVKQALASWSGEAELTQLTSEADLDDAVAIGASFYGWSKRHGGIRIRGGIARSYYIGIETAGLAIPGAPRPLAALCVAAKGMEEGTQAEIPGQEIGVVVGRPAKFRFFSSTTRGDDVPGVRLNQWSSDELNESDPIQTTLTTDEASSEPFLPVRFESRVSELGVFELYCRSTKNDQHWKMEFNARDDAKANN